jgi:probable F420-dependent oxidoreductase
MKVRFAVAPGGAAAEGPGIAAFADALEASGFDGVWLSDLPTAPTLDPLLGLALIAGRSSRMHLGANVVPLGRNPFLLAQELAQLDRLSGGRLLLSFVPGLDVPGERAALGTTGQARGRLLEEIVGQLRRWWSGEAPATVRPVQEPLEIWLGGHGPKALDRAGRMADGWLGAAVTPHEAETARERIQAAASDAGREIDPEHFGLSIPYARAAPDPQLLSSLAARRPGVDPLTLVPVGAGALRELIRRHLDAGLSKFVLRASGAVTSWPDETGWLTDAILDLQT